MVASNLKSALFVLKLDSNGGFLWARMVDKISEGNANSMSIDPVGNILIIGSYFGTIDFDPGVANFNLSASITYNIFILKLNYGGDFVWAKSFDSYSNVTFGSGGSVCSDQFGNLLVSGYLHGVMDFDPGPGTFYLTPFGFSCGFLAKLNSSGNFMWAKKISGNSYASISSVIIDLSGNFYCTGVYSDTIDADPGNSTYKLHSIGGSYDSFILKLDSAGNFIWAKSIGGPMDDLIHSIGIDSSLNVFLTGSYRGKCDFDPGLDSFNLTSTPGYSIFITKLNASGNFSWAKKIGGIDDSGNSIYVDPSGGSLVTGTFRGSPDFDPGIGIKNITARKWNDIFILNLDSSGNLIWVKTMGGTGNDEGEIITKDCFGSIYSTGSFDSIVDFDPSQGTFQMDATNGAHIYIHKMTYCQQSLKILKYTVCDSLILNGKKYLASGSFSQILEGSEGCDSILKIDLDITTINDSISKLGPTLMSEETSAKYQWVTCPSFTILVGDTNKSLTPVVNGSYAVILSKNSCKDTSVCINISGLGINNDESEPQITISPNPNGGDFEVTSRVYGHYYLVNELGQIVREFDLNSQNDYMTSIKNLPESIYFIYSFNNGRFIKGKVQVIR